MSSSALGIGGFQPFNLVSTASSSNIASRSNRRTGSSDLPAPITHGALDKSHSTSPFPAFMRTYTWWRFKRLLSRPLLWLLLVLIALSTWWSNVGGPELSSPQVQSRLKDIFPSEITRSLQFYPASNHKIHYVGRWTPAPNKLRIDGAFPGVYFDLNITNTTTLVLSLQNSKSASLRQTVLPPVNELAPTQLPNSGQYSFSAASRARVSAAPVSLLALVDQEEYVILPNASSLVAVRQGDLDPHRYHSIRVIAPMTDNDGIGIVQLDGLWLDKGGQLFPVAGSLADISREEMDSFEEESSTIGEKHRLALDDILRSEKSRDGAQTSSTVVNDNSDNDLVDDFKRRKKLLEIITDSPANLGGRPVSSRSGGANSLLAGVMGWEYLLGEMFEVDHVSIGVGGMCLLQNCIGGTGYPMGLADVFFRSGPVDSPHFGHPWPFQSYAPDVLIFNLGASDNYSMLHRASEYSTTRNELVQSFEDTYVALIKAIRSNAYPNHPAHLEMERLGIESYSGNDAPAAIPIFIMRPFGGELEHSTQIAVNRLRAEGDKGVFWLDTSGWLNLESTDGRDADFFIDESARPARYRLTERGNQKVSIYLHMHVCRYLAETTENCAFLPPEVYQGQVYDAAVAAFERQIEDAKEKQIKDLFWDQKGL